MITKQLVYKLALLSLSLLIIIGYWVFYDNLNTLIDSALNLKCEYFLDIPTYQIAISPTGELWVFTNDELLEFDGETWRSHVEPYEHSPDLLTSFIEFGPQDRLWFYGRDGIMIYDGKNLEIHNNEEWGLPRTSPTSLTFDSDGRAWVGIERSGGGTKDDPGGGIAVFDGENWGLFSTRFGHTVTYDDITTVQFDPLGRLWVGTNNGTMAVLEIHSFIDNRDDGVPDSEDHFIMSYVDGDGITHYLTYTATIYDRKSNPPIPSQGLADVHAIEFDKGGTAWIFRGGTLYRFDGENFEIMQTIIPKALYGDLAIDPQGNVWFGSDVYDGEQWRTYNSSNSCIRDNTIKSLAFDRSGAIWVSQDFYPDRVSLTKFEGDQQQAPSISFWLRSIILPRNSVGWIIPVLLVLAWLFIDGKTKEVVINYQISKKEFFIWIALNFVIGVGVLGISGFVYITILDEIIQIIGLGYWTGAFLYVLMVFFIFVIIQWLYLRRIISITNYWVPITVVISTGGVLIIQNHLLRDGLWLLLPLFMLGVYQYFLIRPHLRYAGLWTFLGIGVGTVGFFCGYLVSVIIYYIFGGC